MGYFGDLAPADASTSRSDGHEDHPYPGTRPSYRLQTCLNRLLMRLHQATGLVGAGSNTVSSALQSFVYHMIRHPTAWTRVREEINAAGQDGRCRDRVISFKDASELPFLQACIKEAIRVFSPVPMGLPRLVPKGGIAIGSETFSAGTILSVNPWVIHHSQELWGSDASQFNPDRWITGDATEMERFWVPVRHLHFYRYKKHPFQSVPWLTHPLSMMV